MEIAVGFHFLTTTTHPPNVNLPSSGQQVTARLSAHKVSFAGRGGTGPKTPWSGTLQCAGVITQEKDMTSTYTYVIILNKCSF